MNLSTAGACLRFLLLLLLLSPALSVYVGPALKSQWQDPYRGRDHVFHMQLEVSGIELDHLLLSSNYTQMDLYVLFYVPSNPLAKTLLPVWKQVWERFAPIPRVDVAVALLPSTSSESCCRSSRSIAAEWEEYRARTATWSTSLRSRGSLQARPTGSSTGAVLISLRWRNGL
uniref:Hexosyltransferase n=1 Tax=Guillardia theta TaxID=55529 RepID=A0A7S4P3N5_GUITH|mmetsp:Transcript_42686/g.134487  ORF Transcript_42686/g.134487 Transcript_42686/m.134487 type:complete len:172 (+) Transcript_42686:195-710(+)